MEAEKKLDTADSVSWLIRVLSQPRNDSRPQQPSESQQISADKLHDALNSRPSALTEIASAIMPPDEPSNLGFYHKLSRIHQFVGVSESTNRLAGRIWGAALESSVTPESLLDSLLKAPPVDFWGVLRALPYVLTALPLRPAFATIWFARLAEKVGNDFSGDYYWQAVRDFSEHHPDAAIETVSGFVRPDDSYGLHVASFILGTLRRVPLSNEARRLFDELLQAFSGHPEVEMRLVVTRSWMTTAWQSGISINELDSLLLQWSETRDEERNQLFVCICRIANSPAICVDVRSNAVAWLRNHAESSLSSFAKYSVANLVRSLQARAEFPAATTGADLLVPVLPIPVDDKGTWDEVEIFLVKLLESNPDDFLKTFLAMASVDADSLHKVMKAPRQLDWLLNEMKSRDLSKLVSQLVFSQQRSCRRLGLFLFDELGITALCTEELQAVAPNQIQVAFYEFQRNHLHGAAAARLLASLSSASRSLDADFQNEFAHEVLIQARNQPGEFRKELETIAGNDPLVKEVLIGLEKHFEDLRRAVAAGIAAMDVPGYGRAAIKSRREFARLVSDGAKQHSVFMQLCKQVQLLYGHSSGYFVGDQLTPPAPLPRIEHDMELPIVDILDPEGMSLRRIHASSRIAVLSKESEDLE